MEGEGALVDEFFVGLDEELLVHVVYEMVVGLDLGDDVEELGLGELVGAVVAGELLDGGVELGDHGCG